MNVEHSNIDVLQQARHDHHPHLFLWQCHGSGQRTHHRITDDVIMRMDKSGGSLFIGTARFHAAPTHRKLR